MKQRSRTFDFASMNFTPRYDTDKIMFGNFEMFTDDFCQLHHNYMTLTSTVLKNAIYSDVLALKHYYYYHYLFISLIKIQVQVEHMYIRQ